MLETPTRNDRQRYDLVTAEADYPAWSGPPRRSIAVCTQQRSGSTLLGEAIHSAGGLGCPLEYFHAGFRPAFERRWETATFRDYLDALYRFRTDPGGTFSVKLFWIDVMRLLQEREYERVGETKPRRANVRVISATNHDLAQAVPAGKFREDLFYRLNVITVRIPPLRERPEDVPLLASHFAEKHAPGRKIRFTRGAMSRLMAFPWPGNVRQLENEVRRALVLATDQGKEGRIDVVELSADVVRGGPSAARGAGLDLRSRVDALEAELVRDALEKTGGNQTKAAQVLGLSRFGLQKMMKRLKIETRSR